MDNRSRHKFKLVLGERLKLLVIGIYDGHYHGLVGCSSNLKTSATRGTFFVVFGLTKFFCAVYTNRCKHKCSNTKLTFSTMVESISSPSLITQSRYVMSTLWICGSTMNRFDRFLFQY